MNYIRQKILQYLEVGWLVVGFKANCFIGWWVECPPWGVFKGILARTYACFGENHGKLRTAKSTSVTGDCTWHFLSASFELEATQPLAGPRADSLTSLPYRGFEPGTFGAAAGFPSHYNAWAAEYFDDKEPLKYWAMVRFLILPSPFFSALTLFSFFLQHS